jgi:hypothetical protein
MCVSLNQQLLDLDLDVSDQALHLRSVVGENGAGNHWARHAACAAECNLGRDKYIWHVLIFAEQRQVKKNLQGLSVGSHDDEISDTTVKCLGCFVGTLLELLVVGCLLNGI